MLDRTDKDNVLATYATLLAKMAKTPKALTQAYLTLDQAVRRDPTRTDLRRQIIDLAMSPQFMRYNDALDHLKVLSDDSEVLTKRARCLVATRQFWKKVSRQPSSRQLTFPKSETDT